jgi:hypothetical protein
MNDAAPKKTEATTAKATKPASTDDDDDWSASQE